MRRLGPYLCFSTLEADTFQSTSAGEAECKLFIFSGISMVPKLFSRLLMGYDWIIKQQGLGQLLLASAWDKCMFWSNLLWHGFQDSRFFEQGLWDNFRPEIEASLRNVPGAKRAVLTIKCHQILCYPEGCSYSFRALFPRNSSASPRASHLAFLEKTPWLNGRSSAG